MNEEDRYRSVVASVPQNATAAKVMAKGEHWEPKVDLENRSHWENPPPMRPYPIDPRNPEMVDFTGRVFGRLRVIGVMREARTKDCGSTGTRWVVRCACGCYEVRNTKTLKKNKNPDDCCHKCDYLKQINVKFKQNGSRPFSDFHPAAPNDGGRT